MTTQEQLAYAESRWIEAERNGAAYDAVYWIGYMDGLKLAMNSQIVPGSAMEVEA